MPKTAKAFIAALLINIGLVSFLACGGDAREERVDRRAHGLELASLELFRTGEVPSCYAAAPHSGVVQMLRHPLVNELVVVVIGGTAACSDSFTAASKYLLHLMDTGTAVEISGSLEAAIEAGELPPSNKADVNSSDPPKDDPLPIKGDDPLPIHEPSDDD